MPVEKVKARLVQKKILLLGDPAVGKTSLIQRFVYDVFDEKYLATFGAKITKKSVIFLKDKYPSLPTHTKLSLQIWDIAGQKSFKSVHPSYYKGAESALVVCDATRKDSLYNIATWVEGLYDVVGKIPVVLLVNKYDLEDQFDFDDREALAVATQIRVPYYYTSAKTGHNVEAVFRSMAEELLSLGRVFTSYK